MKTMAQGKWSAGEHHLFLKGCIDFGWGKWADIAQAIPTRSVSQVKSHAQKVDIHHPGEKKRLQLENARRKVAEANDETSNEANGGRAADISKKFDVSHPALQAIPTKLNVLCAAATQKKAEAKADSQHFLNIETIEPPHIHAPLPTARKSAYLRRVSDDSNSVVPSKFDVICALGEAYSTQHPGNRQFQLTVEMNLSRFQVASNEERELLIEEVLNGIKSSGGRFVQRRDSGTWKVASDAFARKKILTSFISFMEVRSMF